MIELRRIGLINWHLMPAIDIDLTGDVGIIGENRSGKSTLLDLVQVVMTGNSRRYFRLNASANDSDRKRGLRSVHAYCLGRLSPDQVTRPEGALTYIFLAFADPKDPARSCSIGLALEASPAESAERTLGQFIVPGRILGVADFIDVAADGTERPRDWSLVKPWLEALAADGGGRVYRDEPGKFVADYLKALSTGRRFVNLDQFLKAFVNAISFEQIPSATEFVRRYLLEEKPIRVGQLRESIATYQQLRKDVERAKDRLALLVQIRSLIERFRAEIFEHEMQRWIAARAQFGAQFAENRRLRSRHARLLAVKAEAVREQEEYAEFRKSLQKELQGVVAALATQTQGARHAQFQAERDAVMERRKAHIRDLEEMQRAVNHGQQVLDARPVLPAWSAATLDLIARARTAGGTDLPPAWPRDPDGLAGVLGDRRLAVAALQESCEKEADARTKRQGDIERSREQLHRQIQDIEQRGFSLHPAVESLVEELRNLGYRPRIVCTLLQVSDEQWRHAAEALLGRDREAIIVDDAAVEDAIRYLQRTRHRFRGCRVVNTRKIDARQTTPEAGTLASVLTASDPLAMAFIIRRIGNVRLADTIEELHRPGRAIMRDGTYDDGLTVEMREVAGGAKIGADAGRAGLTALKAERDALAGDAAVLKAEIQALRKAQKSLVAFAEAVGKGTDLVRLCDEIQRCQERLDRISGDLRALDGNADPILKERRAKLEEQIEIYRKEEREAYANEARADEELKTLQGTLSGGEGQYGANLARAFAYRAFLGCRSLLLRAQSHPAYREALTSAGGDMRRAAEAARRATEQLRERSRQTEIEVFDGYVAYHSYVSLRAELTRDAAQIVRDLEPWAEQNIRRIEEVDLVRYESQAAEAAERTRNFFQHSFAFELRDRFDGLHRTIDEMNRMLSGHDFHYERYRFVSHPMDLYRDIIGLVEASRDDDSIFAHLFDAEADAGHAHAKALRTVQDLLLDESRDITEFEDYRRYYAFNLIMRDLKTGREIDLEGRRGTGSGAEQQVPFYVAIGIALAAAYHGKAAGDDSREKGIGLAVFDEAFSKLDGNNQKACMEYYERLGLQVVVAAPYEKRATLYETMESFVETIRNGDVVDIEAYEIRGRTRQAFAQANPANLGLEAFRRMMEGRESGRDAAQ